MAFCLLLFSFFYSTTGSVDTCGTQSLRRLIVGISNGAQAHYHGILTKGYCATISSPETQRPAKENGLCTSKRRRNFPRDAPHPPPLTTGPGGHEKRIRRRREGLVKVWRRRSDGLACRERKRDHEASRSRLQACRDAQGYRLLHNGRKERKLRAQGLSGFSTHIFKVLAWLTCRTVAPQVDSAQNNYACV